MCFFSAVCTSSWSQKNFFPATLNESRRIEGDYVRLFNKFGLFNSSLVALWCDRVRLMQSHAVRWRHSSSNIGTMGSFLTVSLQICGYISWHHKFTKHWSFIRMSSEIEKTNTCDPKQRQSTYQILFERKRWEIFSHGSRYLVMMVWNAKLRDWDHSALRCIPITHFLKHFTFLY